MRIFDATVIATGIDPRKPDIPGISHPKVASYVDVLTGRVKPGREVAIIGMGGIGFDVALFLLECCIRATFDPQAFSAHLGIAPDGVSKDFPKENSLHRVTILKRSSTPLAKS